MQGIIVVNKDRGFTSFDVVAKLRGILKTKKIGHTGTLDPEARGVLVVCVGRATKLVEHLSGHDKTYEAKLFLGRDTDTYDIWGETLSESDVDVTEDDIRRVMAGFGGKQQQIPPMYSAKKIDGKKLYELAREGKTIERKPEDIEIYDITIDEIALPEISFRVSCSKGTYIRSLCHDIGEALGCGGCMSYLNRIKTGDYSIEESHTLEEIEEAVKDGRLNDILIPTDEVLGYKKLRVKESSAKLLVNGNFLTIEDICDTPEVADGENFCVYHPDGRFFATYSYTGFGFKLLSFFGEI